MTNHSFVTTNGNFKPETIMVFIKQEVTKKFGDYVKFDENEDHTWIDISFYEENQYIGSVSISVLNRRKLSFRQGHSEFSKFLEHWLATTVGLHFKGIRSDEGIDDKWEPKLEATNFLEWLDLNDQWSASMMEECGKDINSDEYKNHRKFIRETVSKHVPERLRAL